MLKLRVVQAEFGDCLLLQYGTAAAPRYLLIDGGPAGVYEAHLRPELARIRQQGGVVDPILLSHVDNDHVIGLLALLAETAAARAAGQPGPIAALDLWHNAFSEAEGAGLAAFPALPSFSGREAALPSAVSTFYGIAEGDKLLLAQQELGLRRNPGFPDQLILADTAPRPVRLPGLALWVLGPSRANLARLQREWQAWLKRAAHLKAADSFAAAQVDRSTPNLSSIMLLAQAGRRKILLTGDGLGDDLIAGLRLTGQLPATGGHLHVSILKLPHHGSARNLNRAFFDVVSADTYVISANGRYDNPDLATLIWLVEAARAQGRRIRLVATNSTPATQQLCANYPPAVYGYRLTTLPPGAHALSL